MKTYHQSNTIQHTFQMMQQIRKMRDEILEHRYNLEKNVERRTEKLTRRIELLESCNATLCSKLAQSRRDIAPGDEGKVKLYVLNKEQVA